MNTAVQMRTDEELLLCEIRKRRRCWSEMRAMLGHDADRTISAVDTLLAAGLIRRGVHKTDTRYEAS